METAPPPPPPLRQPPPLHGDVILEILPRLPVKALVRFRCVSTSWRSIISDPNFIKLHLQRSPKNANTILSTRDQDDFYNVQAVPCSNRDLLNFDLIPVADSFPLEDMFLVLGSCNGLVCLFSPAPFYEDGVAWFKFWNPALRLISEYSPNVGRLYNSYFGFGYDNSNDTYKVVAILDDMAVSGRYKVKVHTMGDTLWREIEPFPALPLSAIQGTEDLSLNANDGVYLRGTLNWLALTNFNLGNRWGDVTLDRLHIVSLDLRDETYNRLLLPSGLDEVPQLKPVLGVLLDCMYLCHDYKGTHFVLWIMTEFGNNESWTRLVNVSYLHLEAHFPTQMDDPLVPLCISDDGQVVILANNDDGEIILYNCGDNTVNHAAILNVHWVHPKDYIQSMVLPLPL